MKPWSRTPRAYPRPRDLQRGVGRTQGSPSSTPVAGSRMPGHQRLQSPWPRIAIDLADAVLFVVDAPRSVAIAPMSTSFYACCAPTRQTRDSRRSKVMTLARGREAAGLLGLSRLGEPWPVSALTVAAWPILLDHVAPTILPRSSRQSAGRGRQGPRQGCSLQPLTSAA
jgi:hypothetical protein